jgi:hypothetical protein
LQGGGGDDYGEDSEEEGDGGSDMDAAGAGAPKRQKMQARGVSASTSKGANRLGFTRNNDADAAEDLTEAVKRECFITLRK